MELRPEPEAAPAGGRELALKIQRFDPERDEKPYFQRFVVQTRPYMNLLEALFEVLETQDGSLSFRYACRGAICGSCAMHINGSFGLACRTQVASLPAGEVVIRPLTHLAIIKDLVVDLDSFFAKYRSIRPYLQPEEPPPERERRQSPRERERVDEGSKCILCACCHASCPITRIDPEYLGPAVLLWGDRFVQDSRDTATAERLKLVDYSHGVWRCHTAFNCREVCPKDLNPAAGISHQKQRILLRRLLGR